MTETWKWPHGAKAALSLSYDDGNPNNLDQAIPDLEAAGLRGTFYLVPKYELVTDRQRDWKAAHERGHEIGNHTMHHRCRADGYNPRPAWLKSPLEEVAYDDLEADIHQVADWLDREIGLDPDRSFAYPCGHTAIGDPPDQEAYLRAIRTRHRFARAINPAPNADDPREVNLMLIGTNMFREGRLEQLKSAAEHALATGGWATLCFHGIGGPSHTTMRDVHQALIAWLVKQPLWIAPIRDIAVYIEANR